MKKCCLLIIFGLLIVALWAEVKIDVIANPQPTCREGDVKRINLVREKVFDGDFNDRDFVSEFSVRAIAMDAGGNLYFFDRKQNRIFKTDMNFKLLLSFGRLGQGPGEFKPCFNNYLVCGRDRKLYLHQPNYPKILCFDESGKYVRQMPIKPRRGLCIPAVDEAGNIYLPTTREDPSSTPSINDKLIDIYDGGGKPVASLFDTRALYKTIFVAPPSAFRNDLLTPETVVQVLPIAPGEFAVLSLTNGNMKYVKNRRIQNETFLWPDKLLKDRKEVFTKFPDRNKNGWTDFAMNYFIDGDDARYFYMASGTEEANVAYQFDWQGRLQRVYATTDKGCTWFLFKKNGRFIGLNGERVVVLK
jgi:hypothetical protein